MIKLNNSVIKTTPFKIIITQGRVIRERLASSEEEKNNIVSKLKEGTYTIEHIDTTEADFLNNIPCESIQQAREWLQLGYVPKTEVEILQETLDTLVLSILEV